MAETTDGFGPIGSPPARRGARRGLEAVLLAALAAGIVGCVLALHCGEAGSPTWRTYALRAAVVALSLGAWFRTQALIATRTTTPGGPIGDGLHALTAPLHSWLWKNPKAADAVIIASSFFIDLFGLFIIGAGILGPSLRPFVAMLILFAMRQACQAACALPAPQGIIWRHPGFPSLLVTYGTASDFFFSGHTAVAVLGTLVLFDIGPLWLAVIAAAVAVLEAGVVLVLRAHYTMDVVGGVLAAWLAYHAGTWLLP